MKASLLRKSLVIAVLLLAKVSFAQPTGKIAINEYMPWTSASCASGSEFVELMNFGPGPVDLSCYILTTGIYTVTIPQNTVLQPGQFYVLGGSNFIPGSCANVNGLGVTVDLNWNACGCTNKPVSASAEGFMADNGYSPLVLLDPSLNVVDAVVRALPGAPVTTVTSASNSGCTGKTFNIGSMAINYEELGMAPGKQNSFARTLDGDCAWLKQPQQSGGTTNNRSGGTSDIQYEFDMVNPTSCDERKGSVSIFVKHSNYPSIFPMGYIISQDINNDGTYDFNDQYTTYVDNTPPFIEIEDLPVGRFSVTVFSVKGCYLENFPFPIIPCEPTTLPVRLVYFKNAGDNNNSPYLEWLLQDVQYLQSVVLEKATGGDNFVTDQVLVNHRDRGTKLYSAAVEAGTAYRYYRLRITQKNGRTFYSPVINTAGAATGAISRIWPNPATSRLNLDLAGMGRQTLFYTIRNTNGLAVGKGSIPLSGGERTAVVPLPAPMPPGVYHLQITGPSGGQQPISFRFVKQ